MAQSTRAIWITPLWLSRFLELIQLMAEMNSNARYEKNLGDLSIYNMNKRQWKVKWTEFEETF